MKLAAVLLAVLVAASAACPAETAPGADADMTSDSAGFDTSADVPTKIDATDAHADTDGAPDVPAEITGDAETDAEVDVGPPAWLPRLESLDDYTALQAGATPDVKYLAWVDGERHIAPLVDTCAFQNMALYPFHLAFLQAFEPWADLTGPEYIALVLHADTRIWWGGGVSWDSTRLHPDTGAPGVMLWTLYSDEPSGPGLTVDEVVSADAALAPCMPFATDQRAFWAVSVGQQAFVKAHEAELDAAGIAVVVGN